MTSGYVVIVLSYDAKANLEAIIAPTVNNDETEGYEPGSLWIDTVVKQAYICVDATTGVASWKSFGGIPAGGLLYKGAWNANTNDPVLGDNGVGGVKGDYYVVSVAGTTLIDGISDWQVLDWIVNNGTIWEKVDNTQAAHDMGGSFHVADTLANLNTKVSDATLVPAVHGHTGGDDGSILNTPGPLDAATWGTVTVGSGSPNVVGVGTYFTWESVGAQVKIGTKVFRILSIADDTNLVLDSNHVAGASGAQLLRDRGHTVHGVDALKNELDTPSRFDCTAIGYRAAALMANTAGYITAVGAHALSHCVAGNENTALGALAAKDTTSGGSNTAFGYETLRNNTTGRRNTAVGSSSLLDNIVGEFNTAIGFQALGDNLANSNVAVGAQAMRSVTTGAENVAIGREALRSGLTGNRNVAIGFEAGYSETGSEKLYIAKGRNAADVLIYGDFATRLLGLGTVSPSAALHVKGTLASLLTGTVTVVASAAAVVGVSTLFTTELAVGDAIKIIDEVFTVQAIADDLNLTLDSNHVVGASGVAAYEDSILHRIQTGDGADCVVVTKSGLAAFGDFTTGHVLGALGDVGVGGKLEVHGKTYLDGLVQFYSAIHQYSGTQLRGGFQASTDDGWILFLDDIEGRTNNHLVITSNGNRAKDHDHDTLSADPTLFIHSATDPDSDNTQWFSSAHDKTDGVIGCGKGDLKIDLPVQKTIRLEQSVWDDLRVPLTRGAIGVGNPPTFAKFMDNGAGSVGVSAYAFAYQAVAGNEEQIYFEVQLPHNYKEGTDIKAHIHWSPAVSGAAGEFVKWGLEYTWVNIDGTFGVTTIATSDASSAATATTSGDTTLTADKHYTTEIGADITGTSKLISSMLVCRLFRNSSHADDDLAQDAFGIEFDFHYQIDTLGSRQELVK